MLYDYFVATMFWFGIAVLIAGFLGLLWASIKPERLANPHRFRGFSAIWMIVGVVLLAAWFLLK